MEKRIIPMFVFGTLRGESCRASHDVYPDEVLDAKLHGFRKEGLNIIENPEQVVEGNYFLVTESELQRLDRYEGVDHGFYHRFLVNVEVNGEQKRAYVYQICGTELDKTLID